jgi:hypothetical protein
LSASSLSSALDRRRVARSLGLFYLCAPAMAELWLITDGWAPSALQLLLTCVLGQALGVLLLRGGGDRAPVPVLKGLLTLATIFVTGLCLFSGSTHAGFAYLFLWATPYAFFFSLRHAIAQGAIAAVALVAAHAALDGAPLALDHIDDWLIPVMTLVVVGAMVHRLMGELGRAGRERLRNERERAELEAARAASEGERARREAAVGRLGRMALTASDRQALLDEAVAILTETLAVEHCAIFELVEGGDRVRLAAGAGVSSDQPDPEDLPDEDRLLTGWVLSAEEPVVVWEWAS